MTAAAIRRNRILDDRSQGSGGALQGAFGFCKDTAQGACAGLLSLLGASHMMGLGSVGGTMSGGAGQSFTSILEQVAAGGLAGPVELIAAVVLFLTARRTVARTLGLLLFIGFITAYAQGYTLPDILTALSVLLEGAAGALESIPVRNTA